MRLTFHILAICGAGLAGVMVSIRLTPGGYWLALSRFLDRFGQNYPLIMRSSLLAYRDSAGVGRAHRLAVGELALNAERPAQEVR